VFPWPTLLSLLASPQPAHAVGGALVGAQGAEVPTSAGTQLSIAPDDTGATLILTVQVAKDSEALAVLWPASGLAPNSALQEDPRWFGRLEASTRPRVEALSCDDLVETIHWKTPPGCSSYDYVPPPPLRGEDASESVSAAPDYAAVDLAVEILQPEDLEPWLLQWELVLDETYAAALQPHLDAGEPMVAIRPTSAVAAGQWLPPVRFRVGPGDVILPLTLGTGAASTRHALHVYTVTPDDVPTPVISNYPREFIEDECLLPAGSTGREWMEAARAEIEAAATLPTWVLEHAAPADRCSPCTDEAMDSFTLGALGADLDPAEAQLSRIWASALPQGFDEDVVISFASGSPEVDFDLSFVAPNGELEFAFPLCGQAELEPDPGTCPDVRLPGQGCTLAPLLGPTRSGAAPLLLAALLGLGRRKRRMLRRGTLRTLGPLVSLLLLSQAAGAEPTPDGPPPDLSPRTEVHAGLALLGTDRVVPAGLERGAPWLGNPFFGADVRQGLWGWRDGRSVGVLGSLRGFTGRAAPFGDVGVLGFTLLEPMVELDIRHGRFLEQGTIFHLRYGGGLALPVMVPSASAARAVPSGVLHVGAGWWVGRGIVRHIVEIRAVVVPRTDGYETRYHENTGIPGFTWYPGTFNVWLLVGRAWYGLSAAERR
jgi:hypothetical protein